LFLKKDSVFTTGEGWVRENVKDLFTPHPTLSRCDIKAFLKATGRERAILYLENHFTYSWIKKPR
jgi:hypothetical protein